MDETNATPQPPPTTTTRANIGLLPLVILVIAIISLVLTSLAWWQLHQINHHWRQRLWQLHQQVSKQQSDLNDIQHDVNQLSQQANNQTEDWTLYESLHLLKLAQYNLVFLNDVELAINLLKNANQNLTALNDPSLLNVQQTILNALTQLNNTPPTDIADLLLQINALSTQISQLPFAPNHLPKSNPPENKVTSPQYWWQHLLHNLKQVVIVRREQQPTVPLLLPEQRGYLIENIRYQLSQAQWAILHQQESLYKTSIDQALKSIQNNFLLANETTQNTLKTLERLANFHVQSKVPDISSAITALRQAINARATQPRQLPTRNTVNTPKKNKPVSPAKTVSV